MTPPDPRPPRKIPLDDPADNAPLPPAWIEQTLDRARGLGLHRVQQQRLWWLLSLVAPVEAAAPGLIAHGIGPGDVVVLLWAYGARSLRVRLQGDGSTRLVYYRDGGRAADETPPHPASMLRAMLAVVFRREGR